MAKSPPTKFMLYLEQVGDERAAQILNRNVRTVKSWRRGERQPRPAQAREIVALVPRMSLSDIYDNTPV